MFDPLFVQDLAKYDQGPDYLGPQAYEQAARELFAKERAAVERMHLAK